MSTADLLFRTRVFHGLEATCVEELAASAETRTYERGAFVWRAGESPTGVTLIRCGLIKIVRTVCRTRTAICGLFGPHETVGDLAVIRATPYPADAIVATQEATIVSIPREAIMRIGARAPQLGFAFAGAAHDQLNALHDKIDVLSAGPVESRLATLLLKLYDKFGDDFDDGTSRVPVALSRRELADLVATSFETAIRVMTKWERGGIVHTEPDGFVIQRLSQLEALTGGMLHAAAE